MNFIFFFSLLNIKNFGFSIFPPPKNFIINPDCLILFCVFFQVTFVGDLKHGRTAHSLACLLTNYKVNLNYVSPPQLKMPESILHYVESKNVPQVSAENSSWLFSV